MHGQGRESQKEVTYDILATENCRYAILAVNKKGELRGVIEKPDVLTCSDGYFRVRNTEGEIIEMLTTQIKPVTTIGMFID